MVVRPSTRDEANRIVSQWHSHHKPVRAHRFALAALDGEGLVGVVIVGNPVAQALCDGVTFEVVRLCTDGHPNAASFLLGAAWRTAKAMGVRRMISYMRHDEEGTCYKAAGWQAVAHVRARDWGRRRKAGHGGGANPYLPGLFTPTTEVVDRTRWEIQT